MSLLTYPMPVPAGQHPPFAVVTPTDHRAWIFISAAFGIAMSFMSLGIRAIIRYATRTALGYDDAALGISTLFAVLQTSLILAAVSNGLGESFFRVAADQRSTLQHLYYASNLFYILSLSTSRASALVFLRRVVSDAFYEHGTDILCGILGLWTFASLMALALQCRLSAPWYFAKSECTSGLFTRWAGVEITGAVLEVCIVAFTFSTLVWSLQVSIGRKVRIMIAFSIRALLLILIGVRLKTFHTIAIEQDPTLNIADFVCLTQAVMNFSIVSGTAPMLRVVLTSVPAKFGDTVSSSVARSREASGRKYGSKQRGTRETEGGIQLNSLRSLASRRNKSEAHLNAESDSDRVAFVPVGHGVTTSTVQEGMDAMSTKSQGSQEMIIKKNTTWDVSYDH